MPKIYAFDVYGTLIDTHSIVEQLANIMGDKAQGFSTQWRAKQLEYSFRRAAMGTSQYMNFAECTRAALVYTNQLHNTDLSEQQKNELLASYGRLPAFADVAAALSQLYAQGHHCWAFSNGTHNGVQGLMQHAQLDGYLHGIFSVDALQTFKPASKVYDTFANMHQNKPSNGHALGSNCVLVSSNSFDIIGAKAAGWQAIWVQRSPHNVFDPWEHHPDHTVSQLTELLH